MWLLLGVALLVLELITPGGFYIFFFGVGAIIVGLMSGANIAGPAWFQWILFGGISTALLLLFRKPLQRRVGNVPAHEIDSMIGETAVALVDMGIQQVGKAELRGSAWTALNAGDGIISAGQRCRVTGIDGLTIHIQG
jgi:inner membrane protein